MKPQHLFSIAFALGLAAVIWVAGTAIGGNPLVLVMTLVIGGVFTVGALELRRHRAQTRVLNQALSTVTDDSTDLSAWLAELPEALRQPVRQRVQGERVAPPVPVVTPYLVGLLVMLGMLGTFLGMVVTLSGTAFALQSLTDIQGIRVAFSEPIKGLGLAFGASVAGVATSAMLGLMSTLVRRERLLAWRQIDELSNGHWQAFNQRHQLQQAWVKLQANTQALPQLVEQMGQWMSRVEALQTQFHAQWLAQQDRHQREVEQAHQTLATNVEQTLGQHLSRSTEQTAEQLRALASDTLGQMAHSNQQTAEQLRALAGDALGQLVQGSQQTAEQLRALAGDTLGQVAHSNQQTAEQLRKLANDTLGQLAQGSQQTAEQLKAVADDTMALLGAQAEQVHRSLTLAHEQLLQNQQVQSQAHLARIEAQLVEHLGQLGTALEAPLTRLIDISTQAPQAAAEVIGELRQRINASMARDNELLAERAQIMDHLAQASQSFGQQVQSQGQLMGELSAQLRASAIEVASLGESFGAAVQTLHQTQDQTLAQLQQLEAALGQSINRSDEQMAYYVAQAREVIELSLAAQKPMIESLERVSRRLSPEEA
jgi:hypothetical protein